MHKSLLKQPCLCMQWGKRSKCLGLSLHLLLCLRVCEKKRVLVKLHIHTGLTKSSLLAIAISTEISYAGSFILWALT